MILIILKSIEYSYLIRYSIRIQNFRYSSEIPYYSHPQQTSGTITVSMTHGHDGFPTHSSFVTVPVIIGVDQVTAKSGKVYW